MDRRIVPLKLIKSKGGPLLGPPAVIRSLDLAMRGVDLYVEGLLLQAIEQLMQGMGMGDAGGGPGGAPGGQPGMAAGPGGPPGAGSPPPLQ